MHIVRFHHGQTGTVGIGVRVDGGIVPISDASRIADLLALGVEELHERCTGAEAAMMPPDDVRLLPPVDGRMEVWAAGVTYKNSQIERIKESERAASVYEMIYDAERPELFFKSVSWRVVGDGEPIQVRADSTIDVPEPELALVVNRDGAIVGYTICNDVSSRSIEGENPLYLPQAKIFAGSCALAHGVRPVWEIDDPYDLGIAMTIRRNGATVWQGEADTGQLHRRLEDLVGFLFRADHFPDGAVLSTGTCLVPELPFSLQSGDAVEIVIDKVGTLTNPVVRGKDTLSWLAEADRNPALRPD